MLLRNDHITGFICVDHEKTVHIQYRHRSFESITGVTRPLYEKVLKRLKKLPQLDAARYIQQQNLLGNTTL